MVCRRTHNWRQSLAVRPAGQRTLRLPRGPPGSQALRHFPGLTCVHALPVESVLLQPSMPASSAHLPFGSSNRVQLVHTAGSSGHCGQEGLGAVSNGLLEL